MSYANHENDQILGSEYERTQHRKCFSTRYKIAFLGFLGFALTYSMRENISLAIVAMVTEQKTKDDSYSQECPVPGNQSDSSKNETNGTFDWTTTQQAYVLSGFFFGYLFSQIPFGYLTSTHSSKKLFGFGILLRSVLLMLNPPVAYLGVQWLICVKVLEGIAEGTTLPSFQHLAARWAPKFERSIFNGMATAGYSFGIMVVQPLIGYLCSVIFLGGWPLSFLVNGFLGVIWFFLWLYIASDSPDKHPRISLHEKEFIIEHTQISDQTRHPIPWRSIATSLPFYALLAGRTSGNVISYGIMTCLPLYLSNVLNFDLSENGYLSALPWLCCFIGTLLSSYITDLIRSRNYASTTFIRKFNQFIGTALPGICLVLAGYSGCSSEMAVSFISIGMFLYAFQYSGASCNHLDIAPYFAGTITGIVNTFGNIPGILLPIIVNDITKDNVHSMELWLYCFYTMGALASSGGVLFVMLGSGELQPWGQPTT